MARRIWLLVEWVDERNVFPNYGVVNVNSLLDNETELHPGKLLFIRDKHGNSARRAQVLRISDDKRQVKEHKLLLERQDHQVKNVLSLCMKTIKEMKTDPLLYGPVSTSQQSIYNASGSGIVPHLVAGTDSTSSSDSDSSASNDPDDKKNLQMSKSVVKYTAQYKHLEGHYNKPAEKSTHHKRRTTVSITPAPITESKEDIKLAFDQATQTDEAEFKPPLEKIEQMEAVLKRLYIHFQSLVGKLNIVVTHEPTDVLGDNYIDESRDQDVKTNEEEITGRNSKTPSVDVETQRNNSNSKTLHVRRVSAHTTHNTEFNYAANTDMIPIGAGNVTVPARLMNDINWDSYSTATRQLLQAIFPRRILATHSLTGKQSPAFANRPAKKCLDPKLVNDIVETVSQRCGVSKRLVRSSITIKCTDEAKLYRNRQHGRQVRQVASPEDNQGSVPPSPLSSHGSLHVTE